MIKAKATRKALADAHQENRNLKNEIVTLKQQLHKVTAERDLAIKDRDTSMSTVATHSVKATAALIVEIVQASARPR